MNKEKESMRKEIFTKVKEYYEKFNDVNKSQYSSERIAYAGRVYDEQEMINLTDAMLEFWLTSGRFTKEFEAKFAEFLHIKYCSLVNSGSSANLVAFMTLTSPLLRERRINPGDEVITVAAGFPTTVSPIVQYGAIPVFIDVSIPEYNIKTELLEEAYSPNTKAVFLAHTLGNPFDLKTVKEFCDRHNLWLIEDNCDALGSQYYIDGQWQYTGTIGDIGTSSFYPPHHITMGEGGAVYTNNSLLYKIIRSMRDWGRDCICPSGVDNCCGKRFDGQYGELPYGYDHKYVYSHFGYNLKVTDMQAAVGCAQLNKLEEFIQRRKENWKYLRDHLSVLSDQLILPEPTENSVPSWFGFLITVKDTCLVKREDIVKCLENKGVQTRMLFAGNIVKHPCFNEMRKDQKGYKIVGNLNNTDKIMNNTFWVGVYPGLNESKLQRIVDEIIACVNQG